MAINNLEDFKSNELLASNPGLMRVLEIFDAISRHPRASKQENAVRTHLIELAGQQGWEIVQDETGNIAMRVPASPGKEAVTPVILQGHMDMVTSDADRNSPRIAEIFDQGDVDEIERGPWMRTAGQNMTLGADNGIGVSLAVAAMMDPELEHGPVTILLTVDEETGMTGARGLDPKLLPETGILINLDSEEGPADICIGCAGSGDVLAKFSLGTLEGLPSNYRTMVLELSGFPGGHSGVEIHNGNGNAIQSLADLLVDIRSVSPDFRLLSINGGSVHNAIPGEARAIIALRPDELSRVQPVIDNFLARLKEGGVLSPEKAQNVEVDVIPFNPEPEPGVEPTIQAFSMDLRDRVLKVIAGVPTGPFSSAELPNVGKLVTLSNNLGIVRTEIDGVEMISMARGANIEELRAKIAEIRAIFESGGATVTSEEPSSGWLEDPQNSPAVALAVKAVNEVMGRSRFLAYHAGLEAGLVAGKRPGGLSAVAIGPLILAAHTPKERVSLNSVAQEVEVIRRLLQLVR